jgi:3-deoxy-manno-octulosonate cytidylyltransferase (CMP-KDO synthetase)
MNGLAIIPARYNSSRFPGKPLAKIAGKEMILRVYEQVKKCQQISTITVATEDERIMEFCDNHEINCILTSSSHVSGTDRCIEVLEKSVENFDFILNVQGDEPLIDPIQLEQLILGFKHSGCEIATLIKPLNKAEDILNPNYVKVTKTSNNEALYFSRYPIPYSRSKNGLYDASIEYFKHLGVYIFSPKSLLEIKSLEIGKLEKAESLEQLRWLENGYKIKVIETEFESPSVETPEDIIKLEALLK